MTKSDPRSKSIQDSPIEWYPKRRQQDSSSSAIGNVLSSLPKQEQVTKRSLKPLYTYKICMYYKCVWFTRVSTSGLDLLFGTQQNFDSLESCIFAI